MPRFSAFSFRVPTQPTVAIATTAVALGSLLVAGRTMVPDVAAQSLISVLWAVVLPLAVMASYLFPIHISRSAKVCLSNVPVYLLVVLLPPMLAGTLVGIALLGGELLMRRRRKNSPSDIASMVGRWIPIALIASLMAHGPALPAPMSLLAAAATLWVGDMLTAPLAVAPICKERPLRLLRQLIHEAILLELVQYLLAVPAAAVLAHQPWAAAALLPPIIGVHRYFKRITELHAGSRRLLEEMADAVDQRDRTTGNHSRRVAELTTAMLRALKVSGPEAEWIIAAARVHDIGKIDIPDRVLQKTGMLTPEERVLMEEHPARGAELVRLYPGFARLVPAVRHHHEAWDGTGYPAGLRGDAIPFGARVIAVADTYDAMISDRPYRRGMAPTAALSRLMAGRGGQWDPMMVDALFMALPAVTGESTQAAPSTPPLSLPVSAASAAG